MKTLFSISSCSPKFALQATLATALGLRLLSPILAAGASIEEVRLGGETISSNTFRFSFAANAGQTYPVAVSVDLVNWSLLTNLIGGGGPLWVTDVVPAGSSQRFYQIGAPVTPVPNMVHLHPGTFTMGSPASEVGRVSSEGPQTEVTISRGFWIGKYEVTQQEYVAVIGTNQSNFPYDLRLPEDMVNWDQATNYCAKLTEQERAAGRLPTGYSYRLPTEAEWEYACRAGSTNAFGIGDGTSLSSTQANFDGNFPYGGAATGRYVGLTTIVGSYVPNAWGLYDMHGNLWEWCQDWYGAYPGGKVTDPQGPATGSAHVLRGGGFTSPGAGCRSATRDNRSPGYRNFINGFRVVLASYP